MKLTLEQALGQQFLLSFTGKNKPSKDILKTMRRHHIGGIVLFRAKNMGSLADLRALTAMLQREAQAAGQPPLLIAADQEGGQLMAIGDGTPFPGNMALGATRSEELARRVGYALGQESAAVGVNVDFAPVADVNNNPQNPVVGTRSFGESSRLVGQLSAAVIKGLQKAGVAATAKHFPGHGDTASDSHHGAPEILHGMDRLDKIELPPFRASIKAGVKLMMTAHIALPKLNAEEGLPADLPATLSPAVLTTLLRRKLGYKGVIVTDALDMHALAQDAGMAAETMAAISAGADLVLFNHDLAELEIAFPLVLQAAYRGLLEEERIRASSRRILALKTWLGRRKQPPLSVVGCRAHRDLATEIARRSVTRVRDQGRRLPLHLPRRAQIAVVVPQPEDLTPADTSSYLVPALAAAVRKRHPNVKEFVMPMRPKESDVRALRETLASYDLVIVGTINAIAHIGQAALVNALLAQATPTVAVALRMPYDLTAYPGVETYVCTYSILTPSMEAVADALFGKFPFTGRLPVTLPKRLLM